MSKIENEFSTSLLVIDNAIKLIKSGKNEEAVNLLSEFKIFINSLEVIKNLLKN